MTATSKRNHHEGHDLALIAARASGVADPRADALLEACAECRAELESQIRVRSWLQSAPSVAMADHERAALYSRVSQQLASARSSKRQRLPGAWLLPVGAAAAAVVLVAGLSGVLGRLGSGGAALTTLAGNLAAGAGDATREELYAGAAATEAPATTAAAMFAPTAQRSFPGGNLDTVRAEAASLLEAEDDQGALEAADAAEVAPCLEAINGSVLIRWAMSNLDGKPIVIMIVEEEVPVARAFVIESCEPVDL
jgi:hypothetical protein